MYCSSRYKYSRYSDAYQAVEDLGAKLEGAEQPRES